MRSWPFFAPLFFRQEKNMDSGTVNYQVWPAGIEMVWIELVAGQLFDTMWHIMLYWADGKRSMDLLSEKILRIEPVHIRGVIGKKGPKKGKERQGTQGSMRDVGISKKNLKAENIAGEAAGLLPFNWKKRFFLPCFHQKKWRRSFKEVEKPRLKYWWISGIWKVSGWIWFSSLILFKQWKKML